MTLRVFLLHCIGMHVSGMTSDRIHNYQSGMSLINPHPVVQNVCFLEVQISQLQFQDELGLTKVKV